MNYAFTMLGCHFCHELKKSIILANMNLPLKDKIYTVDIHSGDSRVAFMDRKYPDGRYPLPVTVLDREINRKGNWKVNRAVLVSSSLKDFDMPLIKGIIG